MITKYWWTGVSVSATLKVSFSISSRGTYHFAHTGDMHHTWTPKHNGQYPRWNMNHDHAEFNSDMTKLAWLMVNIEDGNWANV